jgi:geranylgeranyl reductase family protein
LRVLLLDKKRFPRDKICGDAVARKSLGYLRDLGLLDEVRAETHEPIGRAVLSAPSGARIEVSLNSEGREEDPHIVCRREVFDNVLVRAAKSEVDMMEGCGVRDVVRDESGAVCGVRIQDGESEREISARVVVGADGFNSIVARKLGLYRHDSNRWWIATRQYFRNLEVAPGTVEVHYLDDTLPGFLWMFPTGDGTVNVGLGMVHHDIRRRDNGIRAVHEHAINDSRLRERFENATPLGGVHGFNLPTPDSKRVIAGSGFMLTGDAAGLVDPFSGEGIGNAMCSGELAARVAAKACEAKRAPEAHALLRSYPSQLWDALDRRELSLHYKLRNLARRKRLVNFLIGRAAARPELMDWLSGMTAEHGAVERKRALTSPLTYFRLMMRGRRKDASRQASR